MEVRCPIRFCSTRLRRLSILFTFDLPFVAPKHRFHLRGPQTSRPCSRRKRSVSSAVSPPGMRLNSTTETSAPRKYPQSHRISIHLSLLSPRHILFTSIISSLVIRAGGTGCRIECNRWQALRSRSRKHSDSAPREESNGLLIAPSAQSVSLPPPRPFGFGSETIPALRSTIRAPRCGRRTAKNQVRFVFSEQSASYQAQLDSQTRVSTGESIVPLKRGGADEPSNMQE